MKPGNQELGDLLRRLRVRRKGRKRPQAYLASQLRIHKDKPSHWERGQEMPTIDEMKKIRIVLELTGDEWAELVRVYYRATMGEVQELDEDLLGSKSHSGRLTIAQSDDVVGREAVLDQLESWLERALQRARQVVFVTGEAGIGKTTVVEAFRQSAAGESGLWMAHGQCIEQYGTGEAYRPVLEALRGLCRRSGGEQLMALLRRYAPTWLVQMPSLMSAADREEIQRQAMAATRERMLREMAEAIEVLTAERPLVLVLEDLQWSDYSTLDLIVCLARRSEPARLLLIGTYRPEEVLSRHHPLETIKAELHVRGQCEELALELLTEAAVVEYLTARFPDGGISVELARLIHQRTQGNPLFMVNIVDHLVNQRLLVDVDGRWELTAELEEVAGVVPMRVRELIEVRINRLNRQEQRVLETGSVVGVEFSTEAVAAALGQDAVQIEELCEGLAQRGLFLELRGVSEWPDGTMAGRYGFLHDLYQNVLYNRVSEVRRIRLHKNIGAREETGYGERARDIASELALHFERGREYHRAVEYLEHAAKNAIRRYAYQEAINHLRKGLEVLKTLSVTPEHTQQELTLYITLGESLAATEGYAAPGVAHAYGRARELCQQVGETPRRSRVLFGLWRFYNMRGELQTARELGEELLTLTQRQGDPAQLWEAHLALGITSFFLGEFTRARAHCEQSIDLYDPQQHRSHTLTYQASDHEVGRLSYVALALWVLGYPDQALRRIHEALTLAQQPFHPISMAHARSYAAVVHQLRGEEEAAREQAEDAMTLATERGFALWFAMATMLRGWTATEREQGEQGMAQLNQGLAAWRAIGAELAVPYWSSLLAEAYRKGGQAGEGLRVVDQALAAGHQNGQLFYEAELYRLKGECLLAHAAENHAEAETWFHQALDVARGQQAKSLELRAAMSLSRLWQQQGKCNEARQLLVEIYRWFTEGVDTADLQEARALLEELRQ